MDSQDWIPVIVRHKFTKKENEQKGLTTTVVKDNFKGEKQRLVKLEKDEAPVRKRVTLVSIQELIRKRLEMKLTQDKLNTVCAFPKNIIKDIEAGKLIPSEGQKQKLQHVLSIQIKTELV